MGECFTASGGHIVAEVTVGPVETDHKRADRQFALVLLATNLFL